MSQSAPRLQNIKLTLTHPDFIYSFATEKHTHIHSAAMKRKYVTCKIFRAFLLEVRFSDTLFSQFLTNFGQRVHFTTAKHELDL